MLFVWWNRFRFLAPPSPPRRLTRRQCRPRVESLEERRVPSSLVALSTNNHLLAFDSSSPGTIQASVPITGLQTGESILGIDYRPGTGQLYGLGSSNRL